MEENTPTVEEGKNIAIIAYITIIGLIIAFVMNNDKKNPFASFHIRQMLGITLLGIALVIVMSLINIYILGLVVNLFIVVLWVLGLIAAIQGQKKPIPLLGDQFQLWFKNIG